MLWSVSSSTDKVYPGKPSLATTQEEVLVTSSGLYNDICHTLYDLYTTFTNSWITNTHFKK